MSLPPDLPIPICIFLFLCIPIMFSGSNSYLGGQTGRPGAPQYGSFQQQQQQPQQPQQNGPFGSQPTGYGGGGSLQSQFTGYPMQSHPTGFQPQQISQQPTGFQGNPSPFNNAPQQQSFQTGAPPMPQIPQQFQNQNQSQNQQLPAAPMQNPQPTGFAQMADSFKATPTQPSARGRRSSKARTGPRIPNIRLSFITAQDQAKFETLFKSAVSEGQMLSGDQARDLLLRSKLDGNSLSQIW